MANSLCSADCSRVVSTAERALCREGGGQGMSHIPAVAGELAEHRRSPPSKLRGLRFLSCT